MKTIEINNKLVKYPQNWDDITIWDLNKLKLLSEVKEDNFNIFLIKLCAFMCINLDGSALKADEVLKWPAEIFNTIADDLKFLDSVPEFEEINAFIWGGRKFFTVHPFQEDVIVKYVFFDNLILRQEGIWDKLNNNDPDAIITLIACITHEIPLEDNELLPGENRLELKYDLLSSINLEEKKDIFKDLPLEIGLGFLKFFFSPFKDCMKNLNTFSNQHVSALDYLWHRSTLSKPSDLSTTSLKSLEETLLKENPYLAIQSEIYSQT